MNAPGNLNDFSQRVNLYLDKAMNKEDESRFLTEIDHNPRYATVLDQEKDFRSFVKTNIQRSQVSTDLIANIKAKIKVI